MSPKLSARAGLLAMAAGIVVLGGCGSGSSDPDPAKPTAHQSKSLHQMEDFMKTKKPVSP